MKHPQRHPQQPQHLQQTKAVQFFTLPTGRLWRPFYVIFPLNYSA
jgi:hypothetical protein